MNACTFSKSRGHKQNTKEGSQTQERLSPCVQSSKQALSFYSGCTILHFHQEWARVSLHPHQHLSLEFVLITASLSGVRSHWGFDLNFLMNAEHLFRYQLPTWPLDWEDPLEEAWQPTPVFLPGESHGQRNLVCYSPWGCRELDSTECLRTHTRRWVKENLAVMYVK